MKLPAGLQITWLGHSTFKIQTPSGKTVVIDPWLEGNPACPADKKKIAKCDVALITHGHFDHIADAVSLAKSTKCQVVAIYETTAWLGRKGVENCIGMNKGGTIEIEGLKVTMTNAVHSCGIQEDDGSIIYGGEACGYVVEFENGFKVYHAGDTAVFGDMKIIGELYQPDLVCLPIGDHFTSGPREAAYSCRLIGAKAVLPIHFATFPLLTGRPEALRKLTVDIPNFEVIDLEPGGTLGA